jgi:hypothetical protein
VTAHSLSAIVQEGKYAIISIGVSFINESKYISGKVLSKIPPLIIVADLREQIFLTYGLEGSEESWA